MKGKLLLSTLILLLVIPLGSCQRLKKSTSAFPRKKILRWTTSNVPRFSLPQECASEKCFQFAALSFVGLARAEREKGKLKISADLARSWKTVKQQTTVYLREGRWSNGRAITAYDFERSVRHILSSPGRFPLHSLLFALRNARAFSEGRLPWETVGLEAEDATTLRITTEPGTDVELLLSQPVFWPLPPFSLSRTPVISGPFLAPVAEGAGTFTFYRNPAFSGEPAALDALKVTEVANPAARVELFLQKETDLVDEIDFDLPIQSAGTIRSAPTSDLVVLAFRPSRRPFHHRPVREAFQETIDRSELSGALAAEAVEAAQLWEVPSSKGLQGWLPRFTLEDSRQKLAVYRFGSDLFRGLEGTALKAFASPALSFRETPLLRSCAENLRAQWSKRLGVAVDLAPRHLENSWFDAPQSMSLIVLQRNLTEPLPQALGRWMEEIARATGIAGSEKQSTLSFLEEWWVQKTGVLTPLFAVQRPYLMTDRASNLELTPGNYWDFRRVDLTPS